MSASSSNFHGILMTLVPVPTKIPVWIIQAHVCMQYLGK